MKSQAAQVDMLPVLYNLGLVPESTLTNMSTTGIIKIKCPIHNENSPSLFVDLRRDKWVCYACGASGSSAIDFVSQLFHLNLMQALIKCAKLQGENYQPIKLDKLLITRDFSQERREAWMYFDSLDKPSWDCISSGYMFDRGFDARTLQFFDVRINASTAYPVIVPLMENGRFWGYAMRRTDKDEPKYMYNKGLRKNLVLFGSYVPEDIFLLTEGVFDVMAAIQYGASSAGSSLSWKPSQKQIDKMNRMRGVICALDNDLHGDRGFKELQSVLTVPLVRFEFWRKRNKDIRDMREREFTQSYEDARDELENMIEGGRIR